MPQPSSRSSAASTISDCDTESTLSVGGGGDGSSISSANQRRFAASIAGRAGPGKAREAREAVRSSLSTLNPLRGPPMAQPLDYENFLTRNKTALENDPQRDMLLFPRDDITECIVKREERTEISSVSAQALSEANWLLAKESLRAYSAPHRILAFNYAKFGSDYTRLAQNSVEELTELNYEIDILEDDMAADQVDNGGSVEIIKEGYLLQASENSSTVSLHKNFKKRHCIFRKIGHTVELETSKERGSPGLGTLIVEGVLKGTKKGKPVMEIFTPTGRQGHVIMTSETESELDEWLKCLSAVFEQKNGTSKEDTESMGSNTADTESVDSQDQWKGRAAQKALIPPKTVRRDVFGLYTDLEPLSYAADSSFLRIEPLSPKRDEPGVPFLVECRCLTLKVPIQGSSGNVYAQVEPFFLRLYLFDAKSGRRISEEFHCDPNSGDVAKLVPIVKVIIPSDVSRPEIRGIQPEWLVSNGRKALFTVPRPHPEVYLVARIERILQNEAWDAYLKVDPKTSTKLQKTIPNAAEKLGRYRCIFAWTARPVFQELLGSAKESLPLYKCEPSKTSDADLAKFLSDISRPDKASKWQVLPGASLSLHVDLSVRVEEMLNRVSSGFLPVRPFANPPAGPPVLEVQSFPSSTSDMDIRPYTQFFNNLYVYPESLRYDGQKSFGKARNIVCWVQLRDKDGTADATPLQVIFSRQDASKKSPYVHSVACSVTHHDLNPTFAAEEIKMALPVDITDKHHLLFSLGHVAVNASLSNKPADAQTPVETSCGYAWLPLLTKRNASSDSHRLSMDEDEVEFLLPIAAELPENYLACKQLGLGKGYCGPEVKWVDGGRPLLKVKLKLVSSVFSTEPKLQGFFQACQRLSRAGTLADAGDAEKTKGGASKSAWGEDMSISCKALLNVDSCKLIPFLPMVLNQLLALLPLAPGEDVALSCLRTLVGIVDMAIQNGQTAALRQYVRLQYRAEGSGVHESLCKLLPLLLRPAHADASTTSALLKQAWFFFEIATKSMGQQLLREGKHKLQRSERFPAEFLYRVESLVQTFISMLISRHGDFMLETRAANEALAHFIRGCLSLLDRGLMLQLIFFYADKVDRNESKLMREMKLDFLHILTQHEHWVPLSLPVICSSNGIVRKQAANSEQKASETTNGSGGFLHRLIAHVLGSNSVDSSENSGDLETLDELKLTVGYFERHFMVGLVFQEMVAALKESKELRKKSLAVLRNLLAKHAVDPRYGDKGAQSRLATLYLPLLAIVLEILPEIEDVKNATPTQSSPSDHQPQLGGVSPSRDSRKRMTLPAGGDLTAAGPTGDNMSSRSSVVAGGSGSLDKQMRNKSERILSVKTSTAGIQTDHSRNGSYGGHLPLGIVNFAEKLEPKEARDLLLCALYLLKNVPEEYLGVLWRQMSAVNLLEFLQMMELSLELFKYQGRRITLKKTCNRLRVSRRTLTLSPSASIPNCNGDSTNANLPFSVLQEEHLTQEIGLIVLDTLASFCRMNRERFDSKLLENKEIFGKCQDLYVALLSDTSSEDVRLQTLPALGAFVQSFSFSFFTGPLGPISQIGRCLLEQLSSRLLSVQRSASALLQILLRSSYEYAGRSCGLGRFGGQLGVALAHLLGEARQLPDSPSFHRGLTLLDNLASKEKRTSHFDKLVQELVSQLRGVLSATGALREAEKDAYKMAELHLRLADSYRGSAALRQAWLESLAKLHEKEGAYSEAGLCHLHISAMMAKELHAQGVLQICDWDTYTVISENIPKEENVESASSEIENAGIGLDVFTSRVEEAADLMYRAERYESLGPVFRLILPTYEKKRNYVALSEAYGHLQRAYSRVVSLKGTGKRCLATYFRVVFYGKFHFGEDHGREWVYKEPGLTSLAEAAEKLKNQSYITLGHNRVQFLSDSDEVQDKHMTDENVAYVQITHLEPAPEGGTPVDEEDDFWRHANVKRFKFEARLTEDGGRMDDVTKQGKRRIYLYAARSMPYLLRRLLVVSRKEETLSPLQVAVEELRNKSSQIRRTMTFHPSDAKRLQLQLQGAVQTTVNAGPLAYAKAFTEPGQRKRYGSEGVDRLKFAFRELVKVCTEALGANSEMIKVDQLEYQKMLEESFARLVQKLSELFGEELVPLPPQVEEEDVKMHNDTPGNRGSQHVFDYIAGSK